MKKIPAGYIAWMAVWLICCACGPAVGAGYPDRKPEPKEAARQAVNRTGISRSVMAFLGPKRVAVIQNADSVAVYQIDWRQRESRQDDRGFRGYAVLARGSDLDARQRKALRAILLSQESYRFDFSKRSRVRPGYGLRLIQGENSLDILIDFNSSQWAFYLQDSPAIEDISRDQALSPLQSLITSCFP